MGNHVYQQLFPLPGVVGSGEGVGPKGLLQLSRGSVLEHKHSSPFQHSLSQQCSPSSKQVYSGAGLFGLYLGNSICQPHFWISSLSIVVSWVIAGGKFEACVVGRSEEHAGSFLRPTNLWRPHWTVTCIPLHPVVADVGRVCRRHFHWSWSSRILFDLDSVFIFIPNSHLYPPGSHCRGSDCRDRECYCDNPQTCNAALLHRRLPGPGSGRHCSDPPHNPCSNIHAKRS